MQANEQATLIIQQVHEKIHTIADVAEMKHQHEHLYGITLDDPSYVGLCKALDILRQEEQIEAMATVMIEARRANEDAGELIAESLHTAAERLGSINALVVGRPGSWEAAIVLRMAADGGHGNKERIEKLSSLFVQMAEAKADGGDVLSQAMGKAVNEIGGVKQFAGMSRWYWDLINIGCQYSNYEYPLR
jgi:hypothetical protein